MRTTALVFPFDLFGSGGTGAGARLLGDVVREILDDTAKETRPSRADCLRGRVQVREFAFHFTAVAAQAKEVVSRTKTWMLQQAERSLSGALLEARLQRPDLLDRGFEASRNREPLRLLLQYLVRRFE